MALARNVPMVLKVWGNPSGRDENYMILAAFFVDPPHVLSVYKAR